jgi:hypothetical protein
MSSRFAYLKLEVNRMKATLSLAAILFALAAHADGGPIPDAVQEAAFIASTKSNPREFVYCLETNGANPPSAVQLAVARGRDDIVAASDCVTEATIGKGSYHKESGRKAMFVRLSAYHERNKDNCTLQANYYHHGLKGGYETFTLQRSTDGWVVSKRRSYW